MARTIYAIELIEGSRPLVFKNTFDFDIKIGQTENDFDRPENKLKPGKDIVIEGRKIYILIED